MSVDLSCEENFFLSACVFFHIAFVISYVCLSKFHLPSFVFVCIYSYFVYISIMKNFFAPIVFIRISFVISYVFSFVILFTFIRIGTFVFVHIHSYICHPKSYIKHIYNLVMSSYRLQWNFFTIYDRTIFATCHDWCNCTHAWMFISRLDLVAGNAATSKPSKARGFAGSIMKILKFEVTYIQYVKKGGGGGGKF